MPLSLEVYSIELLGTIREMTGEVKPRTYDGSGRQREALERRRRIRAAATRLFAERGYAETPLTAVAEQAGVSVALVYSAFGTKSALLKEIYDTTLAGDDAPVPVLDRSPAVRMREEPDPAVVLRIYARSLGARQERLAPLRRVLEGAAQVDPAARELLEENDAQRLRGMASVAALLADKGGLAPGVDADRARDVLFTFTSASVYDLLVRGRGWSLDAYEELLASTWIRTLLDPRFWDVPGQVGPGGGQVEAGSGPGPG